MTSNKPTPEMRAALLEKLGVSRTGTQPPNADRLLHASQPANTDDAAEERGSTQSIADESGEHTLSPVAESPGTSSIPIEALHQPPVARHSNPTLRSAGVIPQTLLLIQSDPADAKIIQQALLKSGEGSFKIEWVKYCADGLERLNLEGKPRANKIAAVLVDLFLPDSQGIETFDQLFLAAPQIPILVLAELPDEDIARQAVQRGAQDYLLKTRLDDHQLHKAVVNMIERAAKADTLLEENERARITLNSIGEAVMTTDLLGNITYFNAIAESMTGWSHEEAAGHPLGEVFKIIDSSTRATVENPMLLAIRENKAASLAPNCLLIRRDGFEAAIEDSVAPIHDRQGQVTGAVMVFHDVTAARALSKKMFHLAQYDSLTNLPNRTLFSDRLSQALLLAERNQKKLALLFLDIDRFKHVNDSLGHAIGDRLLHSVAQRLLACVRGSDTVSRQGGDEFVILLPDLTQAEEALGVADKILLALSAPNRIDQYDLHITASIGIVCYPDDGKDAVTLLKNADAAMYLAKNSGRNNYQFLKPDMNLRTVERQSLEDELRDALQRQEFVLHYQPKVNLQTGAIVSVEALIRWQHPQRGLVFPEQFIQIAEERGFIIPIGRWILREACRQACAWQDAGLAPIRIAINISAVELRARDFVAGVRDILKDTGLLARYLELELTETFLMQDWRATAIVLRDLKDLGVTLALDDFGTGFCSLSDLKRFPIDTLKIDQSFVHDITIDADDASIVRAVISLGKSLNLRVVAEGVETREQLAFLRGQSCPEAQGYYFSQPLGAGDFLQLLRREAEISSAKWARR